MIQYSSSVSGTSDAYAHKQRQRCVFERRASISSCFRSSIHTRHVSYNETSDGGMISISFFLIFLLFFTVCSGIRVELFKPARTTGTDGESTSTILTVCCLSTA